MILTTDIVNSIQACEIERNASYFHKCLSLQHAEARKKSVTGPLTYYDDEQSSQMHRDFQLIFSDDHHLNRSKPFAITSTLLLKFYQ